MHVLLVTYEFPPAMATGGIGSYMYHLAQLLHNKGHRVSVISATLENHDSIVEHSYCLNYLVSAHDFETFREKALQVFEQELISANIDLIESPEVGACALAIKRKYPLLPLLVKLHTPGVLITKVSNTYQPIFSKLRYLAGALLRGRFDMGYWSKVDKNKSSDKEYQILQLADRIVSPSFALKRWIAGYWQLNEKVISILPNPFTIDADLLKTPIERETKQICFVGKLTVLKGMFSLTPALRQFLIKNPDYKAVLVGRDEPVNNQNGSMQQWMQQKLGKVANRVEFTGSLPAEQVKKIMEKSEVLIVPSLWENYPNVVLEGMAAGCGIAASARGGITEIIKNGKNGLLFNPLSVSSILHAIETLTAKKEYRFKLAKEGRAFIEAHNNDTFINETERIYLSLVSKSYKLETSTFS